MKPYDHPINPSKPDIPVDIEHDPELDVSTVGLVEFFQSNKCKQGWTNKEEGIYAWESIWDCSESSILCKSISSYHIKIIDEQTSQDTSIRMSHKNPSHGQEPDTIDAVKRVSTTTPSIE